MRIAFLDMDHTVLSADSNQLWMDYLLTHHLFSTAHLAAHDDFMVDYSKGILNFSALQLFRQQIDSAIAPDILRQH